MLVDTGSAVSLVREDVWRKAHPGACDNQLEHADCPVVAANGEPLDLLGRTSVLLTIGGVQQDHPVLIARQLTQDCLIGADFLLKHQCVLDLQSKTLMAGGRREQIDLSTSAIHASPVCHLRLTERQVIPGRCQMMLQVKITDRHATEGQQGAAMVEPAAKFMEKHGALIARSLSPLNVSNTVVPVLNPSTESITVYPNEQIGTLQVCTLQDVPLPHEQQLADPKTVDNTHPKVSEAMEQLVTEAEGLSHHERQGLGSLLNEFSNIFSSGNEDLGRTSLVYHKIDTGEANPIKQAPRRLPFHQREETKNLLDGMLAKGIIVPAAGPWASPIVLVKKKDGSTRFCIDFRRVNEITKKDAHAASTTDRRHS